jgi:small subunit ribosomal protein S17
MTEATDSTKNSSLRRLATGKVSKRSGDKTISVTVENLVKHPMYGKFIRQRTKVAVHDPQNAASVGDLVEIVPCRRLSKNKTWRLVRVVREATLADVGR